MTRFTTCFAATAMLALPTAQLRGQESFQEIAGIQDGKSFSKLITRHLGVGPFDDGHGTIPMLKGLDIPKRVALVSFYTFDRGVTSKAKKQGNYIYTSKTWTSQAGANYVSTQFAERGVPEIVAEFQKHGIEVLTPAAFLTDDAKKQAYRAFVPDISGLSKRFLTKDDNFESEGAAVGYLTKPAWAPFDHETAISFGQLARDLGVDAVMVVTNEVMSAGDRINFSRMGMYVFGPNPIARIEGKKYPGMFGAGYNAGQLYEGEDMIVKKPFPFIIIKGKNEGETFDGYEGVARKLAENVATWLDQRKQGKVK
jgi:hypothetical protein